MLTDGAGVIERFQAFALPLQRHHAATQALHAHRGWNCLRERSEQGGARGATGGSGANKF